MTSAVTYERSDDGVGTITMRRPDNRNSMTPELLVAFAQASKQAHEDTGLRALVIVGEGRCFSAGADFHSEIQAGSESLLDHERSYAMYEPFLSILDIEVPVIAAMNGHAVGGGFGLSLVCDIRIGHKDSKYGANFTRIGLHPGMSISYLLPRIIGLSRASELLYTGRLVKGDEATNLGILSQAKETQDEVLEEAIRMAGQIAANAPAAVRLTKQSLRAHMNWNPREGAYQESYAQAATLRMKDAKEGMQALLEKRDPRFLGR